MCAWTEKIDNGQQGVKSKSPSIGDMPFNKQANTNNGQQGVKLKLTLYAATPTKARHQKEVEIYQSQPQVYILLCQDLIP